MKLMIDFILFYKILTLYYTGMITRSATPPGKIVFTTTPVLRPPMIPKARPDPSFIRSITSTWAHSVLSYE